MSFLILIKYGGYEHEEKNSNAIINNVYGSFISNRYTSSKLTYCATSNKLCETAKNPCSY